MMLIIGPNPPKKLILENNNYLIVTAICKIDKGLNYDLYLLDKNINDIGLLNETSIILDELFITLKIDKVFYKNVNEDKLLEYCNFYGVPVYEIID